ncbi:AAA family ATPase [bacterium]|nr:AAA family ATPase [candidate division CSSED10-310 bacterium]
MIGPRQVGKNTAGSAVLDSWNGPIRYATADMPVPGGPERIETRWHLVRKDTGDKPSLLILDEIQKVSGWVETVKYLWDEDRRNHTPMRILLLDSSALLLTKGTTESLAGRFYLHRCLHWSYPEMRDAFVWNPDQWIYFGGYPGAADFIHNESM